MKKVFIAILIFGLFGSVAFAQDTQNSPITSPVLEDLNETVTPVRNEAGATDLTSDISLIDLEVGTSDTLTKTVNEILKNSSNFSSFDWCRDASSFVGDLPLNVKQSLAWNQNSYNQVVDFVPEDENVAVTYKNAQASYADLNVAFDGMLEGLLADQAAGRFIAIARSSAIEALVEFKSGNPSQDRLNGLGEIAKKSIECASPENSDIAVEKLSILLGTSFASANTTEQTVETTYPTTKITRSDINEETSMMSSENVKDLETLKSFVTGLMIENENIVSVEDGEDSVVVRYEIPSKFLGFIKSKTTAKITVDSNLNAKVGYPFFSFLSSKSFKVNAEEMTNVLNTVFESEEGMDVNYLKDDFSAKAKVVGNIAGVLKATEVMSMVKDETADEVVSEEMPTQDESDTEEMIAEDSNILESDTNIEVDTDPVDVDAGIEVGL